MQCSGSECKECFTVGNNISKTIYLNSTGNLRWVLLPIIERAVAGVVDKAIESCSAPRRPKAV